jgi:acyl-CoA synthetase (AMP-forming)/AMP-acid ligase II
MLSHYNLVSNCQQQNALDNFDQQTVLLGVLPFYHIYGLESYLVNIFRAGGTLVIITKYVLEEVLRAIYDYKVNIAYLVPPIIIQLTNSPIVDPSKLASLKIIVSAAAPLDHMLQDRCTKRLNCIVKQAYGMTELSPMTHISPNHPIKAGSCGILLPNTQCRLVNVETGVDVGVGEEGEMVIKGPQTMKGYLHNPHATANTLINGWVHTGDVAKVDKEGFFFIVDRVKELIKVRGFQCAPAELEALLLNHPSIGDCAVVSFPDQESGELPYAFVVLKPNAKATEPELKKYISEQVVAYKRLHGVSFIDSIPRTPSGKILRRVLKTKLPLSKL